MLNRVLRYSPPWISYSKTVSVSGLDEVRAESLFKDKMGPFQISRRIDHDCCFLTLVSPKLWLADFDNRQVFLSELADVLSSILNIATENGAQMNMGYYRPSSESWISPDDLSFRDEFRLHFASQQEQKRFMNETRWVLPLLTSRFGRTMIDGGDLGSQNSYRYSRGLTRQSIGWASTEPVHIARVSTLLESEFGEGGLSQLELYPSYDTAGQPEVVVNCVDAPFFLRSIADSLLLILAISCRNSRRIKNQIQQDRVNSFELQNRFRKASSEGLSARTASSPKSFRVQLLELVSSMRKEFLAIDASKDELETLCAALVMRAMLPNKRVPNTDTEFIRFISKQKGQPLTDTIESIVNGREFLNHKSAITLSSIDSPTYLSVCSDISNWINNEDFELFGRTELQSNDQTELESETTERQSKDKKDVLKQDRSAKRQQTPPRVGRSGDGSQAADDGFAKKQFSEFIEQLSFKGGITTPADLMALLLKYQAMEPVFGIELFKLTHEQPEEVNRFDTVLGMLGLQEYRTQLKTENQECPYLNGALEQLESKGASLLVLDLGQTDPKDISRTLRKFCQTRLKEILCFPIKRYRRKSDTYQRLLLVRSEGIRL